MSIHYSVRNACCMLVLFVNLSMCSSRFAVECYGVVLCLGRPFIGPCIGFLLCCCSWSTVCLYVPSRCLFCVVVRRRLF